MEDLLISTESGKESHYDGARERQLLQRSRIPKPIGDVLFEAWHKQKRHVRFDVYVSPEVMKVTNATLRKGTEATCALLFLVAGLCERDFTGSLHDSCTS